MVDPLVYPLPGFVIDNVPVAPVLIPPKTDLNFPEKLELFFCKIWTPLIRFAWSAAEILVPIPTKLDLEYIWIGFGLNAAIWLFPISKLGL